MAPTNPSNRPTAPIENAFAKFKALLRKAAARTLDQPHRAVAAGIDAFSLKECANYFTAAGREHAFRLLPARIITSKAMQRCG